MNPFKAMLIDRGTDGFAGSLERCFEREDRSGRGARRATSKAQQAKDRYTKDSV